jgi:hypothetical protein
MLFLSATWVAFWLCCEGTSQSATLSTTLWRAAQELREGETATMRTPQNSSTTLCRQKHEEDGTAYCTIFQHLKNDSCMLVGWIVA